MGKYYLSAYNTQSQAVPVGGNVSFPNIDAYRGGRCSLYLGPAGNTITLVAPGTYSVHVNADIEGTAAGNVQLQLVNQTYYNQQGYDVPGSEATVTVADGSTYNVGFNGTIEVRPSSPFVCNTATLSVRLNTTAANVTNIKIIVEKTK